MKKVFLVFTFPVLLFACNSSETKTEERNRDISETTTGEALGAAGQVSTTETEERCFLLTDGDGKDSLVATLSIKGNDITGYLIYNYYQKDGRFGSLIGKKKGDEITANWIYMQEGMKDTVAVGFKLTDHVLQQKENAFDPKNGEEYLPDNAAYYRSYNEVDCSVTEPLVSQAAKFL